MKTFNLFVFVGLFLALIGCADDKKKPVEDKRNPNVVFILVDDLGLVDLGFTGSKFYETPHIDQLASEGMIFTQGYAASRVCSPSRASIMTGKFTARHGVTDWIGEKSGTAWRSLNRHDKLLPADYVHQLPKADTTLAEAMKAAGYKTFFAGKWHLGDKGSYPEDHGFDINIGGWEAGSPIGGYFSPWKNPNLSNEEPGENLSMRLAKETSNFIKANKDSRFFAFLSFYAVHGAIETTEKKWKKYRDRAEEQGIAKTGFKMERVLPIRTVQDNPVYAGLVESMDDAVGLVLETLKAQGLEKNTIVIFTSDNGGVASGDSFSTSNLPLRGGKGYQWEGGIREPVVIKVPWLHNAGSTNGTPVIGTDFYPTILDLTGLELKPDQHKDGVSLKPLMEGHKIADRPLYWHYPHYGNQGGEPSSMIQDKGWKLIHYWEDGRDELYNLATDGSEQTDIAEERPQIARELRDKLDIWLSGTKAIIPVPDPEYDPKLAEKRHENIVKELLPKKEEQRLQLLSKDFSPNADWWGSKVTRD